MIFNIALTEINGLLTLSLIAGVIFVMNLKPITYEKNNCCNIRIRVCICPWW